MNRVHVEFEALKSFPDGAHVADAQDTLVDGAEKSNLGSDSFTAFFYVLYIFTW